jgi:hypothetical protein
MNVSDKLLFLSICGKPMSILKRQNDDYNYGVFCTLSVLVAFLLSI